MLREDFMGIAGMVIGILAFVGAMVGLIPLLGWMNWLTMGLGLVGFILSLIAVFVEKKKGYAAAGLILNILVFCVGIPRLIIGLGVF
jgi:hypothetical protein